MKSITQIKSLFFFFFLLVFASTVKAENIVEPPKTIPHLLKEAAINLEQKTLAPEYKLNAQGELAPLKEYLYYFVDTNADLRIESVSNPSIVSDFSTNYNIRAQGTTWVRLLVAPFELVGAEVPFFDVGANIQGDKNVWVKPKYLEVLQKKENEKGLFEIEELRHGGEIYIAIQGLPSIWFDPRFVAFDANEDISKTIDFVLMVLLILLTLFSALTAFLSRKSWRIALTVFAICSLAINYFGLPVTPKGQIIPTDIATLFAVALALFSLHIVYKGKLKTAEKAKVIDILFLLAGIVGLFMPFLVLVPNFAWCVRYIELWQIYSMIYFLLVFPLLFMGIYASLLCLIGNFILFVSVVFALGILANVELLSAFNSYSLDSISLIPFVGQVLFVMLMVFSKDEVYSAVTMNKSAKKKNSFVLGKEKATLPQIDLSHKEENNNLELEKTPSQAFELKTETKEENEKIEKLSLEKEDEVEKNMAETMPVEKVKLEKVLSREEKVEEQFNELQLAEKIDKNFRPNLEYMMREICFLENQIKENSSIENIMQKVDSIAHCAKNVSHKLKEIPLLLKEEEKESAKQKISEAFDLEELIKDVFAELRREEYSTQVALSWMKAPHVGKYFVGDREYFGALLFDILSDSMRATKKGSVYLRVQRDKCSNNPGRLSFIIGDSGSGKPPYKRSASLLSRIWELTAEYYGDFYAEHSAKGLEFSFTLSFIALEDDGITEKLIAGYNAEKKTRFDKVLIVSRNPKQKYMLAFRLSNIECHILEAMSVEDAFAQFNTVKPSLLIIDNTIDAVEIQRLVNEIRNVEKEENAKALIVLGLYEDENEHSALEFAGCQATLAIAEGREAFRNTVLDLLAYYKESEAEKNSVEENNELAEVEASSNESTSKIESLKFIPVEKTMKVSSTGKKFKFMTSRLKNKEEAEIVKSDESVLNNNVQNEKVKEINDEEELILNPSMVSYETFPEENDMEIDKKKEISN